MARRIPQSRDIKRKAATKSPKLLIIAFCEGKNTEPDYLRNFAREYGNQLVEIELVAPAGAPFTIVQSAVARKKEKDKKKKPNSFDSLYEIWAVFDIDEHPNIPQAIDMAKANNVYTAISNPCIEIWPLLHFTFQQSFIHRHDLQRELAKYMKSYQAEGSKRIDFDSIKAKYTIAKENAIKLIQAHRQTGSEPPFANPCTTFYELLEKIITNGTAIAP